MVINEYTQGFSFLNKMLFFLENKDARIVSL